MTEPRPLAEMLTLPNLRAWLAGRPADETYKCTHVRLCPVAAYLHDNGYPDAKARPVALDVEGDWIELMPYPAEIQQFIHYVDREDGDQLHEIAKPITAAECIAIIDTITKGATND